MKTQVKRLLISTFILWFLASSVFVNYWSTPPTRYSSETVFSEAQGEILWEDDIHLISGLYFIESDDVSQEEKQLRSEKTQQHVKSTNHCWTAIRIVDPLRLTVSSESKVKPYPSRIIIANSQFLI